IVINGEDASSYLFNEITVDDGDRGFVPSYLPSMEGSEVAYIIITNEEMAPVFQTLADWKTRKGVPAVVRTTEWIEQNCRSGADLGESIRNFIREAYAKWGVEWVLLGGDTDIIPARFGYVTFYTGELIPTDMYYSCLDGSWNADGDSLWGEAYHSGSDPGDDADLFSEIFVGRIPATTCEQAEVMVNKTISYATPLDTLSKEKFLFLAEVIFPPEYVPGVTPPEDIILDGAEIAESVYTNYLEINLNVTTSRLYETCALYPGTVCLTKANALSYLNAGTNHVIHTGHGMKYNMSVGDNSILNYDADNLTNGEALFTMYLMNCTNLAFDTDCLAEHFLLNPNGGAFSVTGCSRSAFPSASRPYLDTYYELLFVSEMVQLGKLLVNSRLPYTPAAFAETIDRWTHFIYNYLGDPEVSIFMGRASTFTASMPPTAVFGPNDITVQVYSDGAPYDSAIVCLYKEGDDYAYELTDISGAAVFDDFLCKSQGYICVTITGLNHCRYTDSIDVLQEVNPYLRVTKSVAYDYLIGNNDGVLDAGEMVLFDVKLKNTGQTGAEKLYAILRSTDPAVSITDSISLYPDIPVGQEAYASDCYVLSVGAGVEDEYAIEFTFEIHDSTGGFWSEKFAREVHAPELELFLNVMSDTLPYGNNNGVIEEGESFLIEIGIKNFGTGAAYGLQGKIRSSDLDIVITDSTSVYDDIALLGVEYGDGFVMSETNITGINYYTFELKDAYDRVISKQMELRGAGPPTGMVLNSTYGPNEIHLTWRAPDSTESYRYIVHHAIDPNGPYELASPDLVHYTLFNDCDLLASTRYYYIVTAVDSCGNKGEPGAVDSVTTSPPQLVGWPNGVDKESSSSPKVADIDGDTHPEIVVGSQYIYAWHANGIEVRDGDSQPVTWGILNTEGDNYTATVALADIDGNPGAEIIAASWNTNEIYIFDHDGNTLPGWPQSTGTFCWASPVVGDIDGDGDLEIIANPKNNNVYAWHHDG
ncbi:MAG: VCBS repeat-containing protein, partial [Candidatus Krumholzibacteria bacterium]|nr:VCBS repeat-containing protein [Candidatus Krumholzibacteria bacterium]